MNYQLLKDLIDLVEEFEGDIRKGSVYGSDAEGFKEWLLGASSEKQEPDWEGKEKGRSAESAINTFIVHMNRYAKSYSKSAIYGSDFATQEDFIYLINLKAFGAMSKMELIKKNVHEKPVGMQIIGRLIKQQWVEQAGSEVDKRSKTICITQKGEKALAAQMDKIRQATKIVTGDLTWSEKMELIRLLNKLNDFHQPIYDRNLDPENLLEEVLKYR